MKEKRMNFYEKNIHWRKKNELIFIKNKHIQKKEKRNEFLQEINIYKEKRN